MTAGIRRIELITPGRAASFGGKATSLAALARAGFPVPAAFAVSAYECEKFYRAHLRSEDLPSSILRSGEPSADRCSEIQKRLLTAELGDELRAALGQAFLSLRQQGAIGIAVRSSSTMEDQAAFSAAGLHTTVLNVRSAEALEVAVRKCFASAFDVRALSYLRRHPRRSANALVAVVLQAVVPASVSGVAFTVNPLTGDAGEIVIDATIGLGISVVDGSSTPDSLRVDKRTQEVRDVILGIKSRATVLTAEGGIQEVAVDAARASASALSEKQLDELVRTVDRIEQHFHSHRDIEWAFEGDTLYILQARPVTTKVLSGSRASKDERPTKLRGSIVWSNANVGEALPGVATPFTWSVLSAFSERGFRNAFGSIGCSVPPGAELIGNFRGRIYLNLSEAMSILSQVPGLKARTILELAGGAGADEIERSIETRSKLGFLARLPVSVFRFARENRSLTARLASFEESFQEERRRLLAIDPRILSPLALDKMLADVERLLDDAGQIMLTVYGNVLSSTVALKTVLRVLVPVGAEHLERELLTGLADLESAAPGLRLWYVAQTIRQEPSAREAVETGRALGPQDLPDGPSRKAVEGFLAAYGHRGPREAELSAPRWREDSRVVFASLRLLLSAAEDAGRSPLAIEARHRALRVQADARLAEVVPSAALPAIRHLLALVQRFLRLRERLRSDVTEVLGFFRAIAVEVSARLHRVDESFSNDAAFFLTQSEIHAFLAGVWISDGAVVVRGRRAQFLRDVALADPPDMFVGAPPVLPQTSAKAFPLLGQGVCEGLVTARARVLSNAEHAEELRPGEILVVRQADVGWSPLFLTAGAVVTDLGGPLSHAAIILREFGVPAIVNLRHATSLIHTGDLLRVDGSTGVVELIPGENADA